MKYLLDTNIIVALVVYEHKNVVLRAAACDAGDMVTSSVALAEVAFGTERGDPPSMDLLQAFIEEVPVLDFDHKAALAYAQLPFMRASFDRLIAAHAISHKLIVATANEKDFSDVPGILVENWTI
jgi:tRNA(fMet)-specific endonuclease VapC